MEQHKCDIGRRESSTDTKSVVWGSRRRGKKRIERERTLLKRKKLPTYRSPNCPNTNVPIRSPMFVVVYVFVWYRSLEHTHSSCEGIVLPYHVLSKSWVSHSNFGYVARLPTHGTKRQSQEWNTRRINSYGPFFAICNRDSYRNYKGKRDTKKRH